MKSTIYAVFCACLLCIGCARTGAPLMDGSSAAPPPSTEAVPAPPPPRAASPLTDAATRLSLSTREKRARPAEADADVMISPIEESKSVESTPSSYDTEATPDPDRRPAAGQLTAGEWNDLNHWEFWEETTRGEYAAIKQDWKFQPTGRYTVLLTDQQNRPLLDIPVELVNEREQVLWTARTDNTGKAECWAGLQGKGAATGLRLRARHAGESYYLPTTHVFGQGTNLLRLPVDCQELAVADVKFVVDATGSMGDEIQYLRSELRSVIRRTAETAEGVELRLGAVFYKDATDDYVTRSTPLSTDIKQTMKFIATQSAGGGGDFPEAVTPALHTAIRANDWSPDAVTRVIFLVLDAPPHNTAETRPELLRLLKEAAAKGIQIIPVTASGIDRQTEYLMKGFGLATNGTYVFLTDHSGIGNPHLDPVVQHYDVEKLNDLLVRLLTQRMALPDCSQTPSIAEPSTTPSSERPAWAVDVVVSPNPASDHFNVQLTDAVDELILYTAQGRQVRRLVNLQEGTIRFSTGDLPSGWYLLRMRRGDEVVMERVLVAQV